MTSLDPKIIMREKSVEAAKPIHPASWFRDTRLQIYYRRRVLERIATGNPEVILKSDKRRINRSGYWADLSGTSSDDDLAGSADKTVCSMLCGEANRLS
jgi:hypothetical protein